VSPCPSFDTKTPRDGWGRLPRSPPNTNILPAGKPEEEFAMWPSSAASRVALAAAALLVSLGTAAADPSARVGRVSLLSGPVSYRAAQETQWSEAVVNAPVTSGDAVYTEPGSRAELRIGSAAIRLDGRTELDLDRLDDQTVEAALPEG